METRAVVFPVVESSRCPLTTVEIMTGRFPIEDVTPSVSGGRYPAKAVVGELVPVSAVSYREGHHALGVNVVWHGPDGRAMPFTRMRPGTPGLDKWHAVIKPDAAGRWMLVPAIPGAETEPGLIIYRFGADLFYANDHRFADEVRSLIEHAPTPVRWFIVEAGAITDLDYSAARSIRELLDDLAPYKVDVMFARVSPYLRSDMDRHGITAAIGEARIFTTLHEAIAATRSGPLGADRGTGS